MAMSATIALSQSSIPSGVPVGVVLTVSNSGASAVGVLSIDPSLSPVGQNNQAVPGVQGVPYTGPGSSVSVPAGGSLVFQWNDAVYEPQTLGGNGFAWDPSSIQYSVSALIRTADGSVFSPAAATLTVTPRS